MFFFSNVAGVSASCAMLQLDVALEYVKGPAPQFAGWMFLPRLGVNPVEHAEHAMH